MKSKVLVAVVLVAALALIATACSAPTAAPAPTSGPAPAQATTAPAPAKFTCTDKLGCVDIGPNDPVHIAYAFVTSGDNSTLGLDTKYGAELAVDDVGGKVLGHDIKFDGQDSGCSPEGGQAAATKIAADKTVVGVLGTDCSSAAAAAEPILLSQAGLSMISPANTSPALTDPAKRIAGYYRTAHNDKIQGAVAAQFVAEQLKLKSAATINDGSIYAQGLAQVFEQTFKQDGGTVTASEAVNVGDKDMKPVLTRIATGKPQLVYFPIFVAEGGFICSQIRDVPGMENVVMMGADGIFSPDFLKACGKNVVGMFWSSPNFSAFGSGYQTLVDKYLKKYNVKGTLAPFHAHAYDAMNMLLNALQKPGVTVKDADGTLHVQKQALRDALTATDFQGITGHIKCDQYGDCADPKIAIYQATADNLSSLVMPTKPVWAPGGPDYQAGGAAPAPAPTAAPAQPPKPLIIGFTQSQTGAQQVSSQKQVEGLNLWLDEVKKAGGIKLKDGTVYMPQTKSYDDESKTDRVQALYTTLINQDKADFLFSPYSSGLTKAAAVVSEQNGKLMITAGAADDATMEQGFKMTYQLYTPASRYLTSAVDLLAKLDPSAKKIAIVNEKDSFSTSVANALKPYAESKGYQVVVFEGYDSGTTDFAPFINKIQAANPDAIMGGGHLADGTTFAKQLYEKKVSAELIALLVAPPEPTFADLGDAAQNIIGPSQWEPALAFNADAAKLANLPFYGPSSKEFTAAYEAKYKSTPSYHSAGGYAQGLILQKAIEDADSVDPAKVAAALDKMDLMTFYGVVKFSTDAKTHGKQIAHQMVLMQWQKDASGKLVSQVIWPIEAKSADAQLRK